MREEDKPVPTIPLQEWSQGREQRVHHLTQHYQCAFNDKPSFFVRVPGRVNLIGEHIDYMGYGVFPMSIEQDVVVAVGNPTQGGSGSLHLVNTNPIYPPFTTTTAELKALLDGREGGRPHWHLYFLCGVRGILEELSLAPHYSLPPISCCVDGVIPPSAGLSSSSALVCAGALVALRSYSNYPSEGGGWGKGALGSLCARSERWIGTAGGGMDQAIAFLGHSQHIQFSPRVVGERVELPPQGLFLIGNSGVESNKAAGEGYNVRVAECRVATWILAHRHSTSHLLPPFAHFNQLKQLQSALGYDFKEMGRLVESTLHTHPYTPSEVCGLLGVGLEELAKEPLLKRIGFGSGGEIDLKLYQRITHVLQEAERVEQFSQVCKTTKSLSSLGALMDGSHGSLKGAYECSHPALDTLVELASSASYGARLTGAGWGGCMVALCDKEQLPNLLETLKTNYYDKAEEGGVERGRSDHLFLTKPSEGATIIII